MTSQALPEQSHLQNPTSKTALLAGLRLAGMLWLTCFVAVLLIHHGVLNPDPNLAWDSKDAQGIHRGFLSTSHGGLDWWHGIWINKNAPYFRPVSSYMYWLQAYLGIHFGWAEVAWLDCALYAGVCASFGLFAAARFGGPKFGLLGGVLMCFAGAFNQSDPLAWWPITDTFVCLFFSFLSLAAYAIGTRDTHERWLVPTLWFFLLACLSKEWAFVLPLMFWAVSGTQVTRYSTTVNKASGLILILMLLYRTTVHGLIPAQQLDFGDWAYMYRSFAGLCKDSVIFGIQFLIDQWVFITGQILCVIMYTLAVLVMTRLFVFPDRFSRQIYLPVILLLLSLGPLIGHDLFTTRIYFLWPFAVLFLLEMLRQALIKRNGGGDSPPSGSAISEA